MQPLMPKLPQAAALPLNPLPTQALTADAEALLLAVPAQGEPASESFAGELALGDAVAGEDLLTPPNSPPPVAELPALPLDVERVLHSLLQQRDVQVQAREGEAGEAQATAEVDGAVRSLSAESTVAHLPLPRQLQQPHIKPLAMGVAIAVAAEPAAVPVADAAPRAVSAALPVESAAVAFAASEASDLLPSMAGERPHAVPGAALAPQAAQPVAQPTAMVSAAEQRLALHGPEARWGEQMLNALRDSVELQVRQGMQQATIRLDPPELGSLEIYLSHESGRLQVQISASHGEVARLLQQTSERLRQELVGQHFVQVDVQVGADGHSGQRQGQQARPLWHDDAPLAARETETQAPAAKPGKSADVLVTV